MTKKAHKKTTNKKGKEKVVDKANKRVKDAEKDNTSEAGKEKEEQKSAEEECQDTIAELNKKVEEMNDKYIRLSAEFDNYRKRTLKEKIELTKSAGAPIILSLLPVIDDFQRALEHLDEAKDMAAMKEGIVLIYNKFNDFLSQQGVAEIETKDVEFDTDHHEAITKIPAPSEEMKGKVIDCVEKGYTLNDKVIRFSKVVVGE